MDLREEVSVPSVIRVPVTSGNLMAAFPWECLTLVTQKLCLVRSFAPQIVGVIPALTGFLVNVRYTYTFHLFSYPAKLDLFCGHGDVLTVS